MIVTIDGPAGAGKSTVARALARRIGAAYLDTGAMYRALAWLALARGVDPDDDGALAELAETNPVTLAPVSDGVRVRIAGEDVTERIRDAEVTAAVSQVSAHRGVRSAMVAAQRVLMAQGDWVADGRDVGTVVAPSADVKVFLTAGLDERARRRARELGQGGRPVSVAAVRDEVARRDDFDSGRAESPLRVADGATTLDTTGMDPDQVVARLARLVARARPTGSVQAEGPARP